MLVKEIDNDFGNVFEMKTRKFSLGQFSPSTDRHQLC